METLIGPSSAIFRALRPLAAGGRRALALAQEHRATGRLAQAQALCNSIPAEWPDATHTIHLLGLIAYQSGNLGDAIEPLRHAVELALAVPPFRTNLGEICRLAGGADEAVAHARRALEFNPKNPGAFNNLGIALYERREYQEVLGCYERAIVLTSEFAHAHSNRGNVLHALRRLHDAEAACRRAIELDPRLVRAWNNLGTTLRDLERPQEASPPAAGRSPKRRTIPPRSTIWRSCSRTRSDSAAP